MNKGEGVIYASESLGRHTRETAIRTRLFQLCIAIDALEAILDQNFEEQDIATSIKRVIYRLGCALNYDGGAQALQSAVQAQQRPTHRTMLANIWQAIPAFKNHSEVG